MFYSHTLVTHPPWIHSAHSPDYQVSLTLNTFKLILVLMLFLNTFNLATV